MELLGTHRKGVNLKVDRKVISLFVLSTFLMALASGVSAYTKTYDTGDVVDSIEDTMGGISVAIAARSGSLGAIVVMLIVISLFTAAIGGFFALLAMLIYPKIVTQG